jgi:hypothetical protein
MTTAVVFTPPDLSNVETIRRVGRFREAALGIVDLWHFSGSGKA